MHLPRCLPVPEKEFVVPEEMTILQVIENNKAAKVECLCREGVCGTCETAILEGEADHRDQYFSDEERASQQSMLICCSRAKGKRTGVGFVVCRSRMWR